MAVKHSTPQEDFAARLLILLRCEGAPIHGLEELEAELALQPVVKRPVWATRDYDGWSPRVMADRWDDLAIEPLLRPLFTRAAESVVKIAY